MAGFPPRNTSQRGPSDQVAASRLITSPRSFLPDSRRHRASCASGSTTVPREDGTPLTEDGRHGQASRPHQVGKRRRCRQRRTKLEDRFLNLACWNVRSLLDNEGQAMVSRRSCDNSKLEPRVDAKPALFVQDMKRMKLAVVGLNETLWTDSAALKLHGTTFLSSGSPSATGTRRAGVSLALNAMAKAAWIKGGRVWAPVSSRLISVKLCLPPLRRGGRLLLLRV